VPEDPVEEDVGGDQIDEGTIGGADEGVALITSYSLFGCYNHPLFSIL